MQAQLPGDGITPARVRVGILCHRESPRPTIFEEFSREAIDAVPVTPSMLRQNAKVDVLLVWFRAGTSATEVRNLSRWTNSGQAKIGFIGCAPNGDIEDTIVAFESGVDDFVAGRCGVRELASRIYALRLRLQQPAQLQPFSYRSLLLDSSSQEVKREGKTIRLTSTETSVLSVLISSAGRTLSRAVILDRAWQEHNSELGERAVDNVILRLRRKLGTPNLIETVRGVGFRLAEEVSAKEVF